jgi:glycosyltransferase involved in cell wall biosynthesis
MSGPIRTVALVEWNWMGHHPMYFKLFIRALLDLGCTVLALCPKPEEVDVSLQDLDANVRGRLTLRSITWPPAPRGCPDWLNRRAQMLRSVYRVRKRIRRWEVEQGKSMDLVFFACIYDAQFRTFRSAEWLLPYRWSGLYLHCRSFRKPGSVIPQNGEMPCPEGIFRSSKLHSIAILDEVATTGMEHLSGRPVMLFPDLTDEEVSKEPTPLAIKIRRFASGAPIVVALGSLQYTKGVTTLARLALDPANSDICFVFVGNVEWSLFKPEDRVLISSLMDRCPNAYTHFARVPDEPSFNSVIRASDVIFAAYLDFPNSSGILTKSAVFQKPIIVSDGYLMAERTRQYHLGEVVPEGDVEATGRAVREILKNLKAWRDRHNPKWHEYREKHSYDSLKIAFSNLLRVHD